MKNGLHRKVEHGRIQGRVSREWARRFALVGQVSRAGVVASPREYDLVHVHALKSENDDRPTLLSLSVLHVVNTQELSIGRLRQFHVQFEH